MAIDPTIALQVKQPDALNTIGSFLDLGSKKLALQKAQATYGADVSQRLAESQTAQANSQVAQATAAPKISEAQTSAQSAASDLQAKYQKQVAQSMSALIQNPAVIKGDPNGIVDALDQMSDQDIQAGVPKLNVKAGMAHLYEMAGKNPGGVRQQLLNLLQQQQGAPQQAATIQPSGPMINTGQQQAQINTNPLAGPNGPVAGTQVQNELPPTATTMQGNTPVYVGAQPHQAGSVAAGPALGQAQNVGGTVDAVNKDWGDTLAANRTASQDIGVLQNIIQHAPGAATGVYADRRALWAGLAGYLGIPTDELTKTNTDLLAKNSSMLALAGGNTDSARALAEMANPNMHMTQEAITAAARQIIGQRQMGLAKQQFLGQFKNNPDLYTQKLGEFNQVADPRVMQWRDMSVKEKSALKSALTPNEQAQFRDKLLRAEQMGLVQ